MANPSSAKGSPDRPLWLALQLAWELGYLIALPVAALGFGGAYLDKQLGTMPLWTLLGFAVAAIFSAIAVRRRLKAILSR
jgi:hypothetical protein